MLEQLLVTVLVPMITSALVGFIHARLNGKTPAPVSPVGPGPVVPSPAPVQPKRPILDALGHVFQMNDDERAALMQILSGLLAKKA